MAQPSKDKHAGWERIENPAARRMAGRFFRLAKVDNPDLEDYFGDGMVTVDPAYRRWVRESLRQMQFITMLSDGIGMLPDIREAVKPF